jgi:hypothetical protein
LLGPSTLSGNPESVSQAEQAHVNASSIAARSHFRPPAMLLRDCANACRSAVLVRVRAIDAFRGSGNRPELDISLSVGQEAIL